MTATEVAGWLQAEKLTDKPKFVSRWKKEVWRTPLITDSVRVLLLLLAEHMDDTGHVSKPRKWLAEVLNKHPSRISDRIRAAVEAGFLVRVARGHQGRTAMYVATLPFDP